MRPKSGQERPKRTKRGPRAVKSSPRGRPGRPRRGQERPRGGPGGTLERRRPRGSPEWPPKEAQERSKRGPEEAQERPRRGPGGHRGKDKRTQEETGQEQTRPAAGRDNILTKGLPGPLDPEPLSLYPTYFSCI